jgi:hypothetical protein
MTSRRLWLSQLYRANACRFGRRKFIHNTGIYTKVRLDADYISWAVKRVSDADLLWLAFNLLSGEASTAYHDYRRQLMAKLNDVSYKYSMLPGKPRFYMFDLVKKFAELYIADE